MIALAFYEGSVRSVFELPQLVKFAYTQIILTRNFSYNISESWSLVISIYLKAGGVKDNITKINIYLKHGVLLKSKTMTALSSTSSSR